MDLSRFAVGKPVTIIIIFSLILSLGLFIFPRISIDLYPEFNPPILLVVTTYDGAGPRDIENSVTRILEGNLSNVSDLKEITSTSSESRSMIMLEFDWSKDMSEAANDVRDKLEFTKRQLPDDAETPVVYKLDPNMRPILFLTIEGNRSPDQLRQIAEDIIQPRLEQLTGVALTNIRGGYTKIIRAEVSKNRLEAYSLTMAEISAALANQNIDIGGGNVEAGSYDYLVRTKGEYKSIAEIANTAVAYRSSSVGGTPTPILLKDIAEVFEGFEDITNTVYINGSPGIYLSVQKQSGANSVATAETVVKELEAINKELPRGVKVSVLRDSTTMIKDSISQVGSSAITGGLLAMAILFIFLRSVKSTLIIGISIPVSILITIMGMYFVGITINILSLAGLTLGVGMIVDSSIVILENIFRYREKGAQLKVSAILGSKEMGAAITASTLTTVCVFLPVVLFKSELGILGIMFNDLAFTVVVALLASLLVALVLVPVLSSKYLKIYTRSQKHTNIKIIEKIYNVSENSFKAIEEFYRKILKLVLRKRKTTILIVALVFIISIGMIPMVGIIFFPASTEDEVSLTVELPTGSTLKTTEAIMDRLEEIIVAEVKGYKNLIKSSGSRSGAFSSGGTYTGEISIGLPTYEERIDSAEDIKKILRSHFNEFPGVSFRFGSGGRGPGNANPIDIMVKSDNLDLIMQTAVNIKDLLEREIPELTEPRTDIDNSLPEVNIIFNRERLYEFGLSARAVGTEIRAAINGITSTIYRTGDEELDVVVVLQDSDRKKLPDLRTIYVTNNRGDYIPVSSFAAVEIGYGPVNIKRVDQTRVVHVQAGLQPGAALNEVQSKIEETIKRNIVIDDSVRIEYSGDYGDLVENGRSMMYVMIIALLLVYGVMASQFESFKDPLIMFLTVPLMLIGVVLIHLLMDSQFNILTAIGVVMLVGIVVNNGIVLVDYTNLLVNRGHELAEACVEAGVNRLRPILMTTLTTILGMVPMAFFPGEGSDMVQPIGQTVIGGLATSTIITLVFIPVMYYVFNKKRKVGKL